MSLELIVIAIVGLLTGSFLNVCIHRIPREESIVFPASKCPSCGKPIRPWDNVPVLSYLILGGKCRSCKTGISIRYPIVEALNAIFYVLIYLRFGAGWHLPVYLAYVSSLIVITYIDLDFQIIPDRISLPWIVIGLIAGATVLPDPFARAEALGWANSLIGAVSGFVLFLVIVIASRGGMGMGDVKMMGMVGAVVGWKGVLLTTFSASLVGAMAGGLIIAFKGGGRKTKVPFGPFLALGSLLALFYGQEILRIYLHGGF
jgi:leader peptidase (prepilin peptidase)/N-methyltransferase